MAKSAMGFLYASADGMVTESQADALKVLEQIRAVQTAAHAVILAGFTAAQGHVSDADYSPRMWLVNKTGITRGAAAGYTGWSRRAGTHPAVMAALAEGTFLSDSAALAICRWTDQLPEDCRPAADAILLAAARAGADLRDLAQLAAEIHARSAPEDEDPDHFGDRSLRVEQTLGGAGVIHGDLTPECAAVVTTVLDALAAPAGSEDTRTQAQRYHDGLQDAMERLVASGMLPERSGVPVKVWAHIGVADLMTLAGASALARQWVTDHRAAWAAHRAAASEGGGDGGAWLSGDAATAMACDGAIAPVVSGTVNPGAFCRLVTLAAELAHLDYLGHIPCGPGQPTGTIPAGTDPAPATTPEAPGPEVLLRWQALKQAIVEQAITLLSGPEGLISFVRRTMLGSPLGSPSIPLDIGYSESIPAGIRQAVRLRDKHCQWAGRCTQPASTCQVHHTIPKSRGGKTSLKDCVLLCWYHHQVVIHRLGWTLVVNPDGTTTAWNKDRSKILHSHGPPIRPG